MRHLSSKTRALIDKLSQKRPHLLKRLFHAYDSSRVKLINAIADSGEIGAIPYLRDYALDDDTSVCNATSAAIDTLVSQLRPRDYPWLDELMRQAWILSHSWHDALTPDRVRQLAAVDPLQTPLIGLATSHACGHVRERAVCELEQSAHDGTELPFLLVRCNDWVAEVRQAAARAVECRISQPHAAHFIRYYHLVERLNECPRTDNSDLVEKVRRHLTEQSAYPLLAAGLDTDDTHTRRACFELMVAAEQEPFSDLLDRLARCTDAGVRLKAMQVATRTLSHTDLRNMLIRFAGDAAAVLRRTALTDLAERFPGESTRSLQNAIVDHAISVRNVVRFYLHKLQPAPDFRNRYTAAISVQSGRRLAAAIEGLGEVGNQTDAKLIHKFAQDPLPCMRRATLRALHRLDKQSFNERLIEAIADPSPSVSHTARNLWDRVLSDQDIEALTTILYETDQLHVARNILTLFTRPHRWNAISPVIASCQHKNPALAAHALDCLRRINNRPYTPTGHPQHATLAAHLLANASEKIPKDIATELASLARSASQA